MNTTRIGRTVALLPALMFLGGCGWEQIEGADGLSQALSRGETVPADGIAPRTVTNGLGMKFIELPGGLGDGGERVYLSAHLVTQEEYRSVMKDSPSYFTGADLPVERVSWHDAMAFCEALGEREGRRYRLPFEREWEAACRAGGTEPRLPGHGAAEMHRGGCCGGSEEEIERPGSTAPVREYPANDWGFYDMPGNVWEWCADWDETTGRAVLRGGSWVFNSGGCGEENRGLADSQARENDVGFRIVLVKGDFLQGRGARLE